MLRIQPAALRAHVGQRELHEVERGAHARLERARDVALAELRERTVRAERRVVDEDVDRAERGARGGHEALARLRIEDVALDRDGAPAVGLDRGDRLAQRSRDTVGRAVETARHRGDRRALGGEPPRDRGADSAARAGHERDSSFTFSDMVEPPLANPAIVSHASICTSSARWPSGSVAKATRSFISGISWIGACTPPARARARAARQIVGGEAEDQLAARRRPAPRYLSSTSEPYAVGSADTMISSISSRRCSGRDAVHGVQPVYVAIERGHLLEIVDDELAEREACVLRSATSAEPCRRRRTPRCP